MERRFDETICLSHCQGTSPVMLGKAGIRYPQAHHGYSIPDSRASGYGARGLISQVPPDGSPGSSTHGICLCHGI